LPHYHQVSVIPVETAAFSWSFVSIFASPAVSEFTVNIWTAGESSFKFFVEQPQVGLVGFDISYVALHFSSSAENVPHVSLDF